MRQASTNERAGAAEEPRDAIGFKIERSLFEAIKADAERLRISFADACRFRLRSGRMPGDAAA